MNRASTVKTESEQYNQRSKDLSISFWIVS